MIWALFGIIFFVYCHYVDSKIFGKDPSSVNGLTIVLAGSSLFMGPMMTIWALAYTLMWATKNWINWEDEVFNFRQFMK